MICLRGLGGGVADFVSIMTSGFAGFDGAGFGAALGLTTSGLVAGFGSGLAVPAAPARFDSPRRCTFPITALRVTPPSSLAIWLADWPSPHIFFNVSTRSSVQDICFQSARSGPGWRFATARGVVSRVSVLLEARTPQIQADRRQKDG